MNIDKNLCVKCNGLQLYKLLGFLNDNTDLSAGYARPAQYSVDFNKDGETYININPETKTIVWTAFPIQTIDNMTYEQFEQKYINKDIIIHGITIKPGMVVYLEDDPDVLRYENAYIVFNTQEGLALLKYTGNRWGQLDYFKSKIVAIRDLSRGGRIDGGDLLWKNS